MMNSCNKRNLLASVLTCSVMVAGEVAAQAGESAEQWYGDGEAALAQALALKANQTRAKNVILFVGDGMGISTLTATRIFDGQAKGSSGEENRLSWEKLPYLALSKTYNTNLQTPDSAGTMSAIMTGAKTGGGLISVNQRTYLGHCESSKGNSLPTFLEQAEQIGMATGIVSTARITHATPAATYAHAASRDWESDGDLPAEAKAAGCKDIASQLVDFDFGDGIDVILGGGRRNFLPSTQVDPEYANKTGERLDERDLIKQWQQRFNGQFVWNRDQLNAIDVTKQKKLLGLFSPSHMAFEADRKNDGGAEPSLAEMTEKAIALLRTKPQGFFLMVEGGRIDHAHHAGNAARALNDGQALSEAVEKALNLVDLEETLVIVTADHSHVFVMGGYPARGNPILGVVKAPDGMGGIKKQPTLAADGQPYTTLGYYSGPGYLAATAKSQPSNAPLSGRFLKSKVDTQAVDYRQEALVPLHSETHGGEDVAIFAGGPWAHLFHQTHEQNYIYHVMRHAVAMDERLNRK